ncbi:hypothetical protein P0F65_05675 [Sphingomonas sp. I4]
MQMMLARTSLLLGDAITAEAALDRALAASVPLSATLADRVEARLLLDNLEGRRTPSTRCPPSATPR